ncbi:MAG TPA: DUF3142 domain-containing protein [Chthoniobacterales bacterium]|jgi:hypothetical protein
MSVAPFLSPRCWRRSLVNATLLFLLAACSREEPTISGPLSQRGYLWQRNWNPSVEAALAEARPPLNGIILLGAQINWSGKAPQIAWTNIDWEKLRTTGPHYSLAVRVTPPAHFSPEEFAAIVAQTGKALLRAARTHNVQLQEFQLDFDCAQKNLASYRTAVSNIRTQLAPIPLVVTTLPSWLDEPDFRGLIHEVDGYVLQVHSVPLSPGKTAAVCDPEAARRWVKRAAAFGIPFSVALPTYRVTAGYRADGHLIAVAMDAVQPAWPPDTRVLEYSTDPNAMADLVNEWNRQRPRELRELIWYRLPVATDTRNWRWPTLTAVMAGRRPHVHFDIACSGGNPADLTIFNAGETDDEIRGTIGAELPNEKLIAADALAGWKLKTQSALTLFAVAEGHHLRLPPGASRKIGWVRYNGATPPTFTYRDATEVVR